MSTSDGMRVRGRVRRKDTRLDALLDPLRPAFRRAQMAGVLAGLLWSAQAWAIASLAQAVLVERQPPASQAWTALLLLAAMLSRAALARRARLGAARVAESVKATLRARLAAEAAGRGPIWLRGRRKGALVELSMAHVDALDGYYAGYLPARAEAAWVPALSLATVFAVDWVAGILLLLTAPQVPLFMVLVGWGAEAAGRRQLVAVTRAGAHFADRLRGLELVRVLGLERGEIAGVAAAADTVRDGSLRVLRIAFLSSAVLEFFAAVSVAVIAMYFGFRYLGLFDVGPALAPGALFAGLYCLLVAPEFFAPLRRLAAHYHDHANARAAVAGIEEALGPSQALSQGQSAPPAQSLPVRIGEAVVVESLALAPPGVARPLRFPDFSLRRGQRLAIVGASGAGKSTLLEAMAGWLPATQGRLHVPAGTRIALAPQRPWLLPGTLADNIRFGTAGAARAAVSRAAELAQVWRFASGLPDGLETRVGERGLGLSGGEARRVALARALVSTPDLLLLDEPTAFLDPDTEAALLAALEQLDPATTLVVATHSAAVAAWAGRSVVLQPPVPATPGEGPRA